MTLAQKTILGRHNFSAQAFLWANLWLLLCLSGPARAQGTGSERVYVLALSDTGSGEDVAARTTSVLQTEVAKIIGARLIESPRGTRPRCAFADILPCATRIGKRVNADFVLAGATAGLGDAILVDIMVIDVRTGAEMTRLQSPLTGDPASDRAALRELAVRLIAPDAYVGTLVVRDLEPGDQLIIDGAEVQNEIPLSQLTLPVGQHAVEILRGDQAELTNIVDISFDQTTQITPAQPNANKQQVGTVTPDPVELPQWPFWLSLGTSAVSLLVSVGLFTHYVVTGVGARLAEKEADLRAVKNSQVPVSCNIKAGETRDTAKGNVDCYQEPVAYYQRLTVLDIGGGIGTALLSVAAGVAAVVLALPADETVEQVGAGDPSAQYFEQGLPGLLWPGMRATSLDWRSGS